jgi:Uma2 family endonuclease
VRLEEANCFYYPDISISCDAWDLKTTGNFILSPLLIIEILSKSTENYDRGKKFENYRKIKSLQEYLLVSQEEIHIDHYQRQNNQIWTFQRTLHRTGDK